MLLIGRVGDHSFVEYDQEGSHTPGHRYQGDVEHDHNIEASLSVRIEAGRRHIYFCRGDPPVAQRTIDVYPQKSSE